MNVEANVEGNHTQCLDFDCRGKVFATGGTDVNMRIYDAATGKLDRVVEGVKFMKAFDNEKNTHTQRIFCIKFHPTDFDIMLSGGWDNHVKVRRSQWSPDGLYIFPVYVSSYFCRSGTCDALIRS